ncbi:VacJ family lipoprotein [Fastidiosibacter lacustris]|uniref:MlaA family lipoprotein n=1 Tax=Fastidiosibacter lacustris TaxID=2056695 RepID=UPI000E3496DD|nr:VacJ family lipoprotein [Fastidiosibacter lacustris]
MKFRTISISTFALALSGCATQQNRDPWEGYNRAIFKFNQITYDYAFIPAAKGYVYIVPNEVQTGIDNTYNNILEPGRVANNLLQFNLDYAWRDTARFLANTIFGVFGLFDVGKTLGLPRRTQNFGFTLAKWGYRYSPYFILPILGPNTFGGATGNLVDSVFNPLNYTYISPRVVSWSAYGIYKSNEGVQYLSLYERLMNSSIDPYIAARNAYLQNYDYELDKTLQTKENNRQQNSFASDRDVLDILDQQE